MWLLAWLAWSLAVAHAAKPATFTAAVYEHAVHIPALEATPVTRIFAVQEMMKNLIEFDNQAAVARSQGANIIVFPEDGIYGMFFNGSRDLIYPFLEFIPDSTQNWNPCLEPNKFLDSDVQVFLSCMAKEYNLYVVANFGDKQPCDKHIDKACPSDGRYQFNTDVVYDPDGNYVTKYHKYKLFYEYQFDVPNPVPIVSFDTPFGRFGVFTCFDVLFDQPAVDLVQKFNVSNIVFPTAWMDAGPFLTSVQFHSSFAMLHGVNFLAANIHRPTDRFHGSGIYTPNGAAAYYHNTSVLSGGKLIVENIPTNFRVNTITNASHSQATSLVPLIQKPFTSMMFKDVHTLIALDNTLDKASVCHNDLCCNVTYGSRNGHNKRFVVNTADTEFYALAAFSGNHKNQTYYLQICSIVRCNILYGNVVCGDMNATMPETTKRDMETFTLYGNFSTSYVYPQIYLGTGNKMELTSYPRRWTFTENSISTDERLQQPLGVASMIGRRFDLDRPLYR